MVAARQFAFTAGICSIFDELRHAVSGVSGAFILGEQMCLDRTPIRSVLVLVALVLMAGCAATPKNPPSGKIEEVIIPAPSLAGNLLGDPTEQRLSIYLPPGYDAAAEKRYPVLYLLHGFTGTNRTWLMPPGAVPDDPPTDNGYGRAGFVDPAFLDASIAAGEIPAIIIVAPNGNNANKHSFWVNSPVTGNWEDYVADNVVGYIDANYRTLAAPASRGVAGHSGGANGALFLAMRHADIFGAVYAMSPCCVGPNFSLPFSDAALSGAGDLSAIGQEVFTRLANMTSRDEIPPAFTDNRADFWINTQIAAGAAYAPNPDKPPFYADFLFNMVDGEFVLDKTAVERRKTKANYYLVAGHEDDLRSLRGVFIDYGEYEEDALASGAAGFTNALAERRIPFTLEIYAGGDHGNMIKERFETHGLPFFAATLEFATN